MKFSRTLIWAVALAGVLSGCSSNSSSGTMANDSKPSPAKEYDLKMNPKQGEKHTYSMKIAAQGQDMEMVMSMTPESVKDNEIKMVTMIEDVKQNGQSLPQAAVFKNIKVTQTMDGRGHVLKTETAGGPAGANPNSNMQSAAFPDHPVKVGDTWEADFENNGKKLKAGYKFASVENEGGKQIAKFEVTMPETPDLKPSKPMIMFVDTATGMITKLEMAGTSQGQDVTMTMTRV